MLIFFKTSQKHNISNIKGQYYIDNETKGMIPMEKLIIIKYGELTTKKDNINLFIMTLKQNIKQKLITI